jgi:CheY-like chemotaxis protein
VLPHIFNAFYTTKDKGKGTGLGLSMAQKIARDHGGEITVTSRPGGTSFYLYLPQARMETHAEAVQRAELFNGRGKSIVVVDDEQYMLLFIEMHLKDANYKPILAANGMEALSVFRSNANIAALLSDFNMPIMNGQELAEALRAQGYQLPIVFLTGATEEGDFGTDAVLRKPFSRVQLLTTLQRILNPANIDKDAGS